MVLIWKNKPAWQKGKLNGVGGKIEKHELPLTAMRREFHEETGILHNEWVDLIILHGEDWRVYFFCAIGKVNEFEYVETQEDEEVAKIEVDRLLVNDYPHIPNLDWLVPMAIQRLRFPNEIMSFNANEALSAEEGEREVEKDGGKILVCNNSDAFRYWTANIKGYRIAHKGHITVVWLPKGMNSEMFAKEWEEYENVNNPINQKEDQQ